VLAVLGSESRTLSGPGPHGATLLIDVSDPTAPKLLAKNDDTGGRASAVRLAGDDVYLICLGAIMQLKGRSMGVLAPLYSGGSNLDGASYGGASDGSHAAIAMDGSAVVVKFPKRSSDGSAPSK
jgi:hypothetical protein